MVTRDPNNRIRGLELWATLTSRKANDLMSYGYIITPPKTLAVEAHWSVLVNKLICLKGDSPGFSKDSAQKHCVSPTPISLYMS